MKTRTASVFRYSVILSLGLFLIWETGHAQDASSNARQAAERCLNSVFQDDYTTLANLTYPKVVEIFGGKESFVEMIATMMNQVKEGGLVIDSIVIGTSKEVFKSGEEFHTIVPYTFYSRMDNIAIEQESYLFGISPDGGESWTFINQSHLMGEMITAFVPLLNGNMVIPEPKDPVIEFLPEETRE